MKCPYCNKEMEHGKLNIDTNGTFFEQRFVLDTKPELKESRQIMKRVLGVFAVNDSNVEDCSSAFYCDSCKKVFGEFNVK